MQLQVEHPLAHPLRAVERALLGPRALELLPRYVPSIAAIRLISRKEGPGFVERAAHIRVTRLPAPLGVVTPRSFAAWVLRLRWDRRTHVGRFVVDPDLPGPLRRAVRCEGSYALLPGDAGATVRRLDGELEIRVALFGRVAERAVAAMLREHLAGEAEMLADLAADEPDED